MLKPNDHTVALELLELAGIRLNAPSKLNTLSKLQRQPTTSDPPGGPLPRPRHVTAISAVPSAEISTNIRSPAIGCSAGRQAAGPAGSARPYNHGSSP